MNEFSIDLGLNEIFLLAGLLNYTSVFGIKESDAHIWDDNIKQHIEETMARIPKQIMRYEIDGSLHICREVKCIIDCICAADKVCTCVSNLNTAKNVTIYVLNKESHYVSMRPRGDNSYKIILSNSLDECFLPIGLIGTASISIDESILYDDARSIKELISSFQEESARRIVKQITKTEEAEKLVFSTLAGRSRHFDCRIYERHNSMYDLIYAEVITLVDEVIGRVEIDNNDVVSFRSVSSATILNNIKNHLLSEVVDG